MLPLAAGVGHLICNIACNICTDLDAWRVCKHMAQNYHKLVFCLCTLELCMASVHRPGEGSVILSYVC